MKSLRITKIIEMNETLETLPTFCRRGPCADHDDEGLDWNFDAQHRNPHHRP